MRVAMAICAMLGCAENEGGPSQQPSDGGQQSSDGGGVTKINPEPDARSGSIRVGEGHPAGTFFTQLPSDGSIVLNPGPQGGYHIYLQFQVQGLDPTLVRFGRRVVAPQSGLVLAEQFDIQGLVEAEDGWWTFRTAIETFMCPPAVAGWDMHGQEFELAVRVEEWSTSKLMGEKQKVEPRSVEMRTTITPYCPFNDDVCTDNPTFGCAAF